MTKWVCIPCPNNDCRRDTFLARRDENNTLAEIYCAGCGTVIAQFRSDVTVQQLPPTTTGASGPGGYRP